MTDITYKIISTPREPPIPTSFLSESTALYRQIRATLRTADEDLKKLRKSSSPSSIPDPQLLPQLAKLNKNIEFFKEKHTSSYKSRTMEVHVNSVITCLYLQMKFLSQTVNETEKLKQKQSATFQGFESTRKRQLSLQVPERSTVRASRAFASESEQLLSTLTENNEELLSTQRSIQEINSIMSFFSQKVLEQEEITQRIFESATDSLNYMASAKAQLHSANERSKGLEYYWVLYFLSLTLILWLYEWWSTQVIYTNN